MYFQTTYYYDFEDKVIHSLTQIDDRNMKKLLLFSLKPLLVLCITSRRLAKGGGDLAKTPDRKTLPSARTVPRAKWRAS